MSFVAACAKSEGERAQDSEAPLSLREVTSWEINSPEAIPNPSYPGVLADGSLIVIDRSLNTINHFDANGDLIQTFGGMGRGPGEYSTITYAAVNPDGRVAVADVTNARITIQDVVEDTVVSFDLDNGWHTRLSWISEGLIITNNPFRVGAESRGDSIPGDIIMRRYDPVSGSKEQFFHLELELQDLPPDQISCTFCEFRFMDDFTFFTSPPDTSYRIYKMDPSTQETTLFTRPGVPAVRLTESEQEEWRDERVRASEMTGVALDEEPPTHKRRFVDYFSDHAGRLWALVNVPQNEQLRFDIFSPNAEYIGSLEIPEEAESVEFISGDQILFKYRSDDPDLWKAGLYQIDE
ncbi:hypothetical protein DYD21_08365 [Rhodohalobacter sp. SW132]|nr:hypothetical protein DYD21_08365 [Rhodohalobacter sp. SW132]